ncbi:MAG: PhnD/SsuA/transferrin family substrate-binding protein [Candidatus Dormibacteraeota bacterium]|nr:PhnD/SsuA/transferrin family substrate-binding protein [Candidatus Dormibacteraeota bacterium]
MTDALVVGAVAYTANVVPIWDGLREYFRDTSTPIDFVLFSNYERQVQSLLDGRIDIAWNTNLAWVRTVKLTDGRCRALAMRDIDLSFRSVFVKRSGDTIASLDDLRGRRLALGSRDSTQAAILPLHFLRQAGVHDQVTISRYDRDQGKHGDTGRSEMDCLRAMLDGEADATAIGITTWTSLGRDQLMNGVEAFWETPEYCHCNFTVIDLDAQVAEEWTRNLVAMDWANPEQRRIMEMEGLQRRWVRPQLDGYGSLFAAVEEQAVPLRW